MQNEAISLVAMRRNELWLVQENNATVKLDSKIPVRGRKQLQRKQNWTAKSTNLKENARKVRSVFVTIAALWAEKLGCCLEYCRSWKITPGKLVVPVNTEAEAIRFKVWLKGALVKVQICVLCCCCFSNQFELVSETAIQLTVSCSKLYFARCCALKWTGTFALESKVKLMCFF